MHTNDISQSARFLVHMDGTFLHCHQPPISNATFVRETVGFSIGTQVDGVICHMFTCGDAAPMYRGSRIEASRPVYPEKAATVNMWKALRNIRAITENAPDPWQLAIEMAHAHDKVFWAAMRLNDGHPATHGVRTRFSLDHPQYRIGLRCPAPTHGPNASDGPECNHLDFSEPAVREQRISLIEEVCTLYDVDGFELDLTRDAGHNVPRDKIHVACQVLTDTISKIRAALNRRAGDRGRAIAFAVRVPGTLEVCQACHYEIDRWIQRGLIDVVTPTVYYDTTCELPFDRWVELAKGTGCRVYASVTEGVGPGRFRPPPIEAIRAAALNAWRQGVDGINLFNYHHHTVSDRPDDSRLFSELGHPETLAFRDKLYMIAGTGVPNQSRYFGIPYHTAHPHQLPRDIPRGNQTCVILNIGDDLSGAKAIGLLASVTLKLDLCYLTGEEVMRLTINGEHIPFSQAQFNVSRQYAWNWNGMHGHLEASFDLTGRDVLRQGRNEITLSLHDRPGDIAEPLKWYALRVDLRYHAVAMGVFPNDRTGVQSS